MKKLFLSALFPLLFFAAVQAQTVPQGMKYQAVARTLKGEIMANEKITLRVRLGGYEARKVNYAETHEVTTSELGLFSLTIGEGKILSGVFRDIPWSTEDIWMEVSILSKTGAGFSTISNSKLLAVPYAFHAGTAGKLSGTESGKEINGPGGVPSQSWSLFGNSNTNPAKDHLGTTDNSDLIVITNNTERMKITANGDIAIRNNLAIDKDLEVKNNLKVYKNVDLNTTGGNTVNNGSFTVANNKATQLTGNLQVDGETNLNSHLNVNNQSRATLSGRLDVGGVTKLSDSLKVSKASDFNGRVNINVPFSTVSNQESYDQYPLQVKGTTQGIAITLSPSNSGLTLNEDNNFISFLSETEGIRGRIEAQRGLLGTGWDILNQIILPAVDTVLVDPGINIPPNLNIVIPPAVLTFFQSSYALGLLELVANFIGDIIRFSINVFAAAVSVGVGDIDDVVWGATDIIKTNFELMAYLVIGESGAGVAFESGGADYAEWLPKANPDEKLVFGDVVGVNGGRVSRNYAEAEKFMVVSRAPVIIGGMPDPDMTASYEKIAFMGQVPVKVSGPVRRGDYILPSGKNDGSAIAVHPAEMQTNDYRRIIGIAWSDGDTSKLMNFINTAVGINSNDMAGMMGQMQETMNSMQEALVKLVPGFKPNYYQVSNKDRITKTGITTRPSVNETIISHIGLNGDKDIRKAMKAAKDYASTQGNDFSKFPMLNELFENPTAERAQQTADYYTRSLQRLQKLIMQLKEKKIKS